MYIKTKTLTIVASLLEIIARKINKKLQVFFEILPYIKEPKCTTFSMNDKKHNKKVLSKNLVYNKNFLLSSRSPKQFNFMSRTVYGLITDRKNPKSKKNLICFSCIILLLSSVKNISYKQRNWCVLKFWGQKVNIIFLYLA